MCWRSTRGHAIPDYPLVCLDETSKQFLAETRLPIPMKRGRPARCDYEYERNGTANIFMMFAPLEGWRHVKVTDRPYRRGLRSRLERIGRSLLRQRQDRRTGPGTISTSTARGHSTKRFQPPRPGDWSSASNGTTLQSTVAGLIWQSPNSASSRPSGLDRRIADKQTLVEEIAAWSTTAMPTTPRPIGNSQPPCPYQTQAPLPAI